MFTRSIDEIRWGLLAGFEDGLAIRCVESRYDDEILDYELRVDASRSIKRRVNYQF